MALPDVSAPTPHHFPDIFKLPVDRRTALKLLGIGAGEGVLAAVGYTAGEATKPKRADQIELTAAETSFNDFATRYLDQFIEVEDPGPNYSPKPGEIPPASWRACMDAAFQYCKDNNIPLDTIRHLYAKDVILSPNSDTKDYWDITLKANGKRPNPGSLLLMGEPYGNLGSGIFAGHIAIADGRVAEMGKDSQGNDRYMASALAQNDPIKNSVAWRRYDSANILGWLTPKEKGGKSSAPGRTAPEATIAPTQKTEVLSLGNTLDYPLFSIKYPTDWKEIPGTVIRVGVPSNSGGPLRDINIDVKPVVDEVKDLTPQDIAQIYATVGLGKVLSDRTSGPFQFPDGISGYSVKGKIQAGNNVWILREYFYRSGNYNVGIGYETDPDHEDQVNNTLIMMEGTLKFKG